MDIKRVIKEKGWTIARVAAEMKKPNGEKGLPQSALSQLIINGNPSYSKLQEIADIIGVSVSELVSDDNGITALVKQDGNYYHASTVEELEQIVKQLKK